MPTDTETETAAGPGNWPATRSVIAARRAITAKVTGDTIRIFYFLVLVVALVGSSTAAKHWLIEGQGPAPKAEWWHLPAALVAVAVYELGAVAVSRFADARRQLGERALVARAASAGLAGGAIAAQALGHDDIGPALFFAGVSLTGYVIYLLESAANRRDALREEGKLADTPPAYGLSQWIRHFWITRRARALALARAEARLQDKTLPPIGRVASLAAAADQVRAERRLAAIEDALRARIAAGVDKTMAQIAVNTYDMGRVAAGIAAAADYPALTRIITAELVPARLVKLDDDQAATDAAAAAITEHVTQLTGPARPAVVPAGVHTLPIVSATAPVPPAPAVETDPVPVSPATVDTETVTETDPVPAPETGRRRFTLDPVPPPLTSLVNGGRRLPGDPPVPAPTVPETDPVPARPDPPASTPDTTADQGETEQTAPETGHSNGVDPLAGVEAKLLPYLRLVTVAHPGWASAVKMPPRHPDALTVGKILEAAKVSGKALGCDLKKALDRLAEHPETAEAALRSHGLAAAGAN